MTDESWRKSSYSGGSGGNCVEVGQPTDGVTVRDTKNREGAKLRFTADAWRKLTETIKQQ